MSEDLLSLQSEEEPPAKTLAVKRGYLAVLTCIAFVMIVQGGVLLLAARDAALSLRGLSQLEDRRAGAQGGDRAEDGEGGAGAVFREIRVNERNFYVRVGGLLVILAVIQLVVLVLAYSRPAPCNGHIGGDKVSDG